MKVPAGGGPLVNAGTTPAVTDTEPDAGPVPTPLVAVTEQEYEVPFARPVTVIGLPAPLALNGPGRHVAVKLVIALPPFEAGAVNAMVACPSPGVALPIVGAPGSAGPIVIEKACVVLPDELVAVTTPVNVPTAFGVPVNAPVEPLRESPPGKAPEVRLNVGAGEPLAVYVCE